MKIKATSITLRSVLFLLLCAALFSSWFFVTKEPEKPQSPPPKQIPLGMHNDFTLNGKVGVSYWYRDDTLRPENAVTFKQEEVATFLTKAANKEQNYYGETDTYLYAALEKHIGSIQGKKVAVIGSLTPWYESIVLSYGGNPVTIEYNKITNQEPRIEVLTVAEYEKKPQLFDALISISSLEHDGLGRYGDPINPNGDFCAMKKMKAMLKKDGLLFLSVPISKDHLWWNVHRIYGRMRFPLLIQEWDLIDSFGFQDADLDYDHGMQASAYQPVFVLKPKLS